MQSLLLQSLRTSQQCVFCWTFLVAILTGTRFSTGASREAPVDNARFWLQSWRARLSTGASREAPVDNARFWLQS